MGNAVATATNSYVELLVNNYVTKGRSIVITKELTRCYTRFEFLTKCVPRLSPRSHTSISHFQTGTNLFSLCSIVNPPYKA